MEKVIQTSENSPNVGSAWLENYENICMIKLLDTEHIQTNIKFKIRKQTLRYKFGKSLKGLYLKGFNSLLLVNNYKDTHFI